MGMGILGRIAGDLVGRYIKRVEYTLRCMYMF